MGFLFPLFLLAAVTLLIPLVLHLFNLRKYKQVNFPDIRFLRDLQMSSRRQSKVQHWWLMLLRMLFLAALILAFAQPFIGSSQHNKGVTLHAIFIDNSYSMTAASGQRSRLDKSKSAALDLVRNAASESRFVILSHDRTAATRSLTSEEAIDAIQSIKPTALTVPLSSILNKLKAAEANERDKQWQYYVFSDLQEPAFVDSLAAKVLDQNQEIYLYTPPEDNLSNVNIDTCYFLNPVLGDRQANLLLVELSSSGKESISQNIRLQVLVNDQIRTIKELSISKTGKVRDTLLLQLSGSGWQRLSVIIEDQPISFDDTFRLAAKIAPQLQVLVTGQSPIQPYLQSAFSHSAGFKNQFQAQHQLQPSQWSNQNLIVVQDLSGLSPALAQALKAALDGGQQVLIFPSYQMNIAAVNGQLSTIAELQFSAADTSRQQVAQLHQQHPLLRDVFESVPDNVELPTTLLRYPIQAGWSTQQQTLMSYRDGTPFLAQYSVGRGKLFVCAAPLSERYSNFSLSNMFVPILYKMAIQNSSQQVYAKNIGDESPIWISMKGVNSRSVVHLSGHGQELIPAQQPAGSGLNIFASDIVPQAGFYRIHTDQTDDTLWIGMNVPSKESLLTYAAKARVEQLLSPAQVNWLTENFALTKDWQHNSQNFPLWSICVIIALFCLLLETWLLLKKKKTATINEGSSLAN